MNNEDLPAMPVKMVDWAEQGGYATDSFGLTKREHMEIEFAKALIMSPNYGYNIAKHVADDARKQADAMIAIWEGES